MSLGKWWSPRSSSTLFSRTLSSTGAIVCCIPSGSTSMSIVSTMSMDFMSSRCNLFSLYTDPMEIDWVQVCHTLWLDLWIRAPCRNPIPRLCHHSWACIDRAPPVHSLAVDDPPSSWNRGSPLWLSLPLEPLQFYPILRRVSLYLSSLFNIFTCRFRV